MAKRSADVAAEKVKEAVVIPVEEVDLAKFSVKQRGKDNDKPFFYASYDHQQMVLNLTTEKWFRIAFAIERDPERPDQKMHSFNVSVEVDAEVANAIQKIEDVAKEIVLAAIPKAKWMDSVRQSGSYDPVFRAKLVVKAQNEAHLSACTVREFGKAPVRGIVGDQVLVPLLQANKGFADAKVKLGVALASVYTMNGKFDECIAGVTWRITNLMADLAENTSRTYPDIFANEEFPAQ